MEIPKFSRKKKFLEFGMSIKFDTDQAKQRFIEEVMSCGDDGLFLGRPMIAMNTDNPFPKNKELPIIFSDIESLDIAEMDELVGENKIKLVIETSIDDWVMDFKESEPRKVTDLSEEEKVNVPE